MGKAYDYLIVGAGLYGAVAAYELKKLIPGSKLHIYSGLGHAAYEEAPDFYSRIFDFLSDAKN